MSQVSGSPTDTKSAATTTEFAFPYRESVAARTLASAVIWLLT